MPTITYSEWLKELERVIALSREPTEFRTALELAEEWGFQAPYGPRRVRHILKKAQTIGALDASKEPRICIDGVERLHPVYRINTKKLKEIRSGSPSGKTPSPRRKSPRP